jgi:hypothetical protein
VVTFAGDMERLEIVGVAVSFVIVVFIEPVLQDIFATQAYIEFDHSDKLLAFMVIPVDVFAV